MKTIIYEKFGAPEVLQLIEMERPVPKDNEVLIKINAATINSGDLHMRSGNPFIARLFAGPIKPRNQILGTTLAGEVAKTGKNVTQFKIGDEVFGSLGIKSGTHTEYLVVPEDGAIVLKPSGITYEEASLLSFGPQTAKYFLEKANVSRGMKVLVIGAAGSVGSSVIQLAKIYGIHTTGVCSTNMVDFVKELGADDVIDYNKEDILESSNSYDIIFDTVGKYSIYKLKRKLKSKGTYISLALTLSVVLNMLVPKKEGKTVLFDVTKVTKKDLLELGQLTNSGEYKALIEKTYTIEDYYMAHKHAEKSSKKGSVILKM